MHLAHARYALPLAFFLAACNGGMTTPSDAAPDQTTGGDAADVAQDHASDAAGDMAVNTDGSTSGCNPDGGIQCDGNWVGHCTPDCAADQCCSPQHGVFSCVPRDASGNCPAPDLYVDMTQVMHTQQTVWAYFDPTACEIVEGCVNAPGVRRILRFDTRTPNQGTADLYLGQPSMSNPNFQYSACHNHYHFNTYAAYSLNRPDGTVAATGHKQAFCLEDFERAGATDAVHYTCGNQGIQMGWADRYYSGLPCQWVDVTDVPPGNYTLNISINTAHVINESNYDNNTTSVPVTITSEPMPDPDPRTPCTVNGTGLDRVCGWTFQGVHTCTAGAMVNVGCSAACSLGSCSGDTMIRVYEGDRTAMGSIMFTSGMIASNDDSGCAMGDLCSRAQFMCPSSGQYTVLTGPYDSANTATCTVATNP